MVNYKQSLADSINIGGFVHILKSTDKIIRLKRIGVGATGYETMLSPGAVKYQVPSGKQARIFYITLQTVNNSTSNYIGYSDAEDLGTNEVNVLTSSETNEWTDQIFLSKIIPALKYPFTKIGSGQLMTWDVFALEEDA